MEGTSLDSDAAGWDSQTVPANRGGLSPAL